MSFSKLCDVSPVTKNWCVRARVARMWDYCGARDGQTPLHLDFVLVDEGGNFMYAEAAARDVDKMSSSVKEGGVYAFSRFLVVDMKPSYKPFCAKYMIRFTSWTKVDPVGGCVDMYPRFVFHLTPLSDLSLRVGSQVYFTDVLAMIIGVSNVTYVRMANSASDTPRRVVVLKDLSGFQIKLVLWGNRALEFDAEAVHELGQEHAVVGIFAGTLVKSYRGDENLSGGLACKWYLNEDIPEIDEFFDRLGDEIVKIEWVPDDDEGSRQVHKADSLVQKTVSELRALDPWEAEGTNFLCTVTVVRLNTSSPWWFSSCSRCHRAATLRGSEYQCSCGCTVVTAVPKFRVCLVCSDGTSAAEFVLFGRVAQQVVGKPVMSLMRSDGVPREIAALVSHKFTFIVTISQKSLLQRTISFQVNGVQCFLGRQACVPDIHDYDGIQFDGSSTSSVVTSSFKGSHGSAGPPAISKHVSTRRKPLISSRTTVGGDEKSVADIEDAIGEYLTNDNGGLNPKDDHSIVEPVPEKDVNNAGDKRKGPDVDLDRRIVDGDKKKIIKKRRLPVEVGSCQGSDITK